VGEPAVPLAEPSDPSVVAAGAGAGAEARVGAPPVRRFNDTAIVTPANAVTMARVVLTVPWLWLIATDGASWPAVAAFLVLAASDGLDGWLARRDGETRSGAFLDPLADKFFTVGAFVALAADDIFGWLPVGLVAGREVAIQAYRSLLGRRGISLPATMLGKVKTNVQMGAVMLAITPRVTEHEWLLEAGLWIACAFTLWSGAQIIVRGARTPGAPPLV
jgi:CDP-diacylglycerol---glycerol-3-phosphate 3-phosphatidyltransferase